MKTDVGMVREQPGGEESNECQEQGHSIYSTIGSRPLLKAVTSKEAGSDDLQEKPKPSMSSVKDTSILHITTFKVSVYWLQAGNYQTSLHRTTCTCFH